MKISEKSLSILAKIVAGDSITGSGDSKISPYRTGPMLVNFFNNFGFKDTYEPGFPSRWYYTEEKLRELNETPKIIKIIETVLDPRDFLGTQFKIDEVINTLNQYFEYDGYKIIKNGKFYTVASAESREIDSNQGVGAGYIWNNLKFRSKTEIKIAEELDKTGVLFLPNCKARLNTSKGKRNLEADFLVCHEGKWGILEVDGPHHTSDRRVEEQERERFFRHYRIFIIERFDAEKCYNQPEQVVKEFLELLRKSS